ALSEGHNAPLQYYVFDLLYLNGKDLTGESLLTRKKHLAPLIKNIAPDRVIYSEHFHGSNDDFLQRICGMQLEGIVSKRADTSYNSGRGKSWFKTKCHHRQEFVIGGFTLPTHAERGIGSLLLGYYEEEALQYAGRVGTGLDNETSLRLRRRLDA